MYPNQQPQQNLGFYVPPPMHFDNAPQQNMQQTNMMGGGGGLKNMLNDLMASKPSFDTNLWGTNKNVYASKYKWLMRQLSFVIIFSSLINHTFEL